MVFDDEIFGNDEEALSSVAGETANSRVKREPPPSLEEGERRGGRHRQLVNGGSSHSTKSASLGHWDRHQQKTKKQLHHPKQQHAETDDNKDAKQHHDRHKAVAQKKSQVVARANLKQLEPNHKKHNNNNHNNKHSKKNQKKVPAVLKIDDDDEDLMLGDGSGSGDGEINLPSPPSQGAAGSGTRSKNTTFFLNYYSECGLKIMAPNFYLIAEMYRCSLLVQEPYVEELGDRDSSDFSEMADRFNIAVDNLYLRVSGTQTTNVQTFE